MRVHIALGIAVAALLVALSGNLITAQQAVRNCERIEAINDRVRNNARESYDKRAENARLLGITLTKELEERLLEERDETLRRYAPVDCAIFPFR